MGMKQGREYRAVQDFSLVPRAEEKDEYRVRGTAVVFDTPTVLFEYDGVKYSEVIDRNAFDECDMSDVIFNYNHGGKVVARLRNKTLTLTIDERGLHMEADLGGTQAGRELYEEIDGGYAAFGKVIEGMDVVNKIAEVRTDYMDKPLEAQVMKTVTVETFGVDYPEPETV